MWASTIFLLARTMRWATVASATRNALPISAVVKPATARKVSATCASCDRAGWQHVKISLRRSSASAGSGVNADRSSSASFSRYRVSRRRMSMARRRAVVINHAPGLSGMPCSGHFSNAATRLSWTTSSARSKSPIARTSAAVSRPASSRKTATTAASVAVRVCSAVLGSVREPSGFRLFNFSRVVDHRPHLDRAGRPCLSDSKRLVEILDLDNREASDDLLRLDVWPVGDDGLAILDAHRCRAAWALELLATDESAGPGLLLEPLACPLIGGGKLVLRQLLKRILVLGATHEHKDVLHFRISPYQGGPGCRLIHTTNGLCAKSTLSGPGEFRLLLREEAHDPNRGVRAQRSPRKVGRLDLERLVKWEIVAAPDGVFDHRDGERRRFCELGGPLVDGS